MSMLSINPVTGQTIQFFPIWQADTIDTVLREVESAQVGWALLSVEQRAVYPARGI